MEIDHTQPDGPGQAASAGGVPGVSDPGPSSAGLRRARGGLAAVADLYLDSLRSTMLEHAQPLSAAQVKVVVSRLGDKANLLGCARLALEHAGKRV